MGEGRGRGGEGRGSGIAVYCTDLYSDCVVGVTCRDTRLGHDGSESVRRHSFFRSDKWTWDNIRHCPAPFVPEVSSDEDTEYFDEIDPDKGETESFPPATVHTLT